LDIEALLRRLHLPTVRRLYADLEPRAEAEGMSHRDYLATLMAEEVAHRAQTRIERSVRRAKFPFLATMETFDFTFQTSVRQSLLGSFLGPELVSEGRCAVLLGPSGTGKTHLAVAIAYRAIQNGYEALFTDADHLLERLSLAARADRLRDALQDYVAPDVLVVDEVGYLDHRADAANVLFHVVNERHLRHRPTIFTTNKPLAAWGKVLHDPDLAEAILDRVLERGRLIELRGPSYRTRHLGAELRGGRGEAAPRSQAQPSPAPPGGAIRPRPIVSGKGVSEFPEPTAPGAGPPTPLPAVHWADTVVLTMKLELIWARDWESSDELHQALTG
jgi:DNA replication protein DnaC